jgi:aminoglycoside phosphotransferase (APT) family kinase protein
MTSSANEGRGYESPIRRPDRDLAVVAKVMTTWLSSTLGDRHLRVVSVDFPKTSGVANETLLLRTAQSASPSFVVRIATARPLFIDRPIRTQYLMHEALAAESGLRVPAPVGYEPDPEILGSPFYVTEYVHGVVPGDRPHFSEAGFVRDANPQGRRRLWENAVDTLAALHRVPVDRFTFLDGLRRGHSGLDEELEYWRLYAEGLDVGPSWNRDMLDRGWEWLLANLPNPAPTALSWGDSRIGNMIFRDPDITDDYAVMAILDWDTVSLAGPEADLAWWIQMDRRSYELLPGLGSPDELIERWEKRIDRPVENLHWHLVLTAFRLGVIRTKLKTMMVARGALPPAQALPDSTNDSIELMALWLGETPPAESLVRKPSVQDL